MNDALATIVQQLLNGLTSGSLYVLVALSVTTVFGLTGIVNFAVGQLMMVASYVTLTCVNDLDLPYWVAALVAVACLAVCGVALEAGLFRWTLPNPVNGFIISLGLILIIQAVVIQIYGANFRTIPRPLPRTLHVGKLAISETNLMVLVIAVVVMIGFLIWLYRTRSGRALRALSEDRATSGLMGIRSSRLIAVAFAIGVGLAAVAGALVSGLSAVDPFVGDNYLVKGFVIATVGGLGSVNGAFIAGMGVALTEAFSAQYLPTQWTSAYVFAVMAIVLLLRPAGLFGIRRG